VIETVFFDIDMPPLKRGVGYILQVRPGDAN
jgi:hypothetical protein